MDDIVLDEHQDEFTKTANINEFIRKNRGPGTPRCALVGKLFVGHFYYRPQRNDWLLFIRYQFLYFMD